MEKKFQSIESITDRQTYDEVMAYINKMVDYATRNGYLKDPDADNEYTQELGRAMALAADYESIYMDFKHLKVKNPLIISIENEIRRKALNQRQTAELLDVKENTLSQIMTGKRNVSMKLAKKLYKTLNIDPKLILEFA